MRAVALCLWIAAAAGAQTLQVWEALDVPVIDRGRVSGVLHTQFRTGPNLHDYHQARVGTIMRVELSPRATSIGGYYFGETEEDAGWRHNHRTFGGIETPVTWRGRTIGLRTMLEHHFGGDARPEVRFREQVRVVRHVAGPVSAVFSAEPFFHQNGFFQQRTSAGVRLPFVGGYSLHVTYFYDARVGLAAPSRHVMLVGLRPGE